MQSFTVTLWESCSVIAHHWGGGQLLNSNVRDGIFFKGVMDASDGYNMQFEHRY